MDTFHVELYNGTADLYNIIAGIREELCFLFAAFEAANFQIEFFGNPVMRTAE